MNPKPPGSGATPQPGSSGTPGKPAPLPATPSGGVPKPFPSTPSTGVPKPFPSTPSTGVPKIFPSTPSGGVPKPGAPPKTLMKISLNMDPSLAAQTGAVAPGAAPAAAAPKPIAAKVQVAVQEDVAIVTILDSRILDESNITALGKQLMELVQKQYMVKMVLDLGEVKYLSSAVLRQFIALYKAIKQEKGDLKLCKVRPEVREVFKITQLDKMIEIKDDLPSAINSFKAKGGWGFLKR